MILYNWASPKKHICHQYIRAMEHHNMVNKCTAFMQRFNNQWPITLLYNIAQHSSTHAQSDGDVHHARPQPAHREQLGAQGQGHLDTRRSQGSNKQPSGYQTCSTS